MNRSFRYILLLVIFFTGCHVVPDYNHVFIKKKPLNKILPYCAHWLQKQGYELRSDSLLYASFNPKEWGKEYVSLRGEKVIAISNLPEHVTFRELTFYPSQDSIEISLYTGEKLDILMYGILESELNGLADSLRNF